MNEAGANEADTDETGAAHSERAFAPLAPRMVCLQVMDDGPGFAPGFNVSKSANTGLDLVVNISRLDMNGQVTFANNPGGGAHVCVTFAIGDD